CPPEKAALVLSLFTGASRELEEALLVNPYDRVACAEAMEKALSFPEEERRRRNEKMRSVVARNNIFRWAGRTLTDLFRMEFAE
ncbi:MAG: trehalose-6-phosphate synthase, partial [Elusimicrobia bacterium]|nr:trehalose-6-phosphate synthase [Elusimicrobiota bacterium]